MLKMLLPKSDQFFLFFENHALRITSGAKALLAFAEPKNNPKAAFEEIKRFEQEADQITHSCQEALHKTFITPIDRGDIHRLISTMDDVLDEIEDVGKFMVLYNLEVFTPEAVQLTKILIEAVLQLEIAVKKFRNLKHETLNDHFITINQLENKADIIFVSALERLFREEKDAIKIIQWKEVYEHMEHATDACEDVANILEGIILEYE